MDLGELYAGPWQDFVAGRDRLAAAAKAAGDAGGARAIKALRKPTRGAWLVNLLARHETERLAEVLELGESLARAHRDADPDELRRLSALRGAVVNSLAGRATALGAERGYAAPDSIRQEVSETIQAAMADPALADRVLAGAMTATVRAAGFGPADLFAAAPDLATVIPFPQSAPAEPAAPAVPAGPDPAEVRRLSRDLGRAEARWEEARDRLQRADAAATTAAEALADQTAQVTDVGERAAALRSALAAAELQEQAAIARRDELAVEAESKENLRRRAAAETAEFAELIERLNRELAALGIEP